MWLRLGVWLWPDVWLHRYHKMRKHGSKASAVMRLKALELRVLVAEARCLAVA